MKNHKVIIIFSFLVMFLSVAEIALTQDVQRMSKEELKAMIDDPDLVTIDVRSGRDWKSSESKIKAAVREDPSNVKSWADKYEKNKKYVLYYNIVI